MSPATHKGRVKHPASAALRQYGLTCASVCHKAGVYGHQWSSHFVTGRHNGPSAQKIRDALREMLSEEQYQHVISLIPFRPYNDGKAKPLTARQREIASVALTIDEMRDGLRATGVPQQTIHQWKLKLRAERDR